MHFFRTALLLSGVVAASGHVRLSFERVRSRLHRSWRTTIHISACLSKIFIIWISYQLSPSPPLLTHDDPFCTHQQNAGTATNPAAIRNAPNPTSNGAMSVGGRPFFLAPFLRSFSSSSVGHVTQTLHSLEISCLFSRRLQGDRRGCITRFTERCLTNV